MRTSLLFLLFLPFSIIAQTVCTPTNQQLIESRLQTISQWNQDEASSPGISMIKIGKTFLGTPYVSKTLEVSHQEKLVLNMQGLDCTTFLENVLVLTKLLHEGSFSMDMFKQTLTQIRYRSGMMDAYPSRLHYFSEWITDNVKKGIIENITPKIGGIPYEKTINFMSTHRNSYAQLKTDDTNWKAIQLIETRINQQSHYFIPKTAIHEHEAQIQDGDIIAITTTIKGLDVVHTGMAIRKNGRIHLFHASTGSNEVEISQKPLAEYMAGIKHQNGIMVARVK